MYMIYNLLLFPKNSSRNLTTFLKNKYDLVEDFLKINARDDISRRGTVVGYY